MPLGHSSRAPGPPVQKGRNVALPAQHAKSSFPPHEFAPLKQHDTPGGPAHEPGAPRCPTAGPQSPTLVHVPPACSQVTGVVTGSGRPTIGPWGLAVGEIAAALPLGFGGSASEELG